MQETNGLMFQVSGDGQYTPGPIGLEQPVGSLPVVDDARWSADLTSNSVTALLVWVLLLIVLQAAFWPLAQRIFARFPDRGWAFSRLLTLVVAGYLVWLPASLELVQFRAIWCGVAVAATAAGAWALGRFLRPRDVPNNERRSHRSPTVVMAELVFWAMFGLFLLYRFLNHDSWHVAWGGEKPMEFAHINAILRSAHFPPYDPWYADGTLNYYYYGMYLVAFLMKLTGIPSEIAFNLAQPTMMGLLAAGAFSVAAALSSMLTRSAALARVGGLAGVVLVTISGNLVVASRLVQSLADEVTPPLSDYGYWFWGPTRIVPFTINEFPYFTGTYADLHAHVVALPITVLVIAICLAVAWDGRRLLVAIARPRAWPTATLGLWTTMGLLALALGTLFITNAWDVPTYAALAGVAMLLATREIWSPVRRIVAAVGLTMLAGGAAYVLTLPFSQSYVALYGDIGTTRSPSPLVTVAAQFGVFFLIVTFGLAVLLSREWVNPPLLCHPLVLLAALTVGLLARWRMVDRPDDWIKLTDGLVVLVAVLLLMFGTMLALPEELDFGIAGWVARVALVGAWFAMAWALAVDKSALSLFLGLGAVAGMLWLMPLATGARFVAALIGGGMFVGAAMELVYLVDGLDGGDWYRMNTVFKFYNAVWVMLALGSAALVALMVHRALQGDEQAVETVELAPADAMPLPVSGGDDGTEELPARSVGESGQGSIDDAPPGRWTGDWARVGLAVTALAVAASLAFPVFATGTRLSQQFPQEGATRTLNALDWMSYGRAREYGPNGVDFAYAEDRAIIEWFNTEVAGSPVIAEASLNPYACAGSRIAVHTGLPVVVGWVWHEVQQRDWVDLQQRQDDLRTLYTTADPEEKIAIIDRYRIEYVVVGDIERQYPSNECHSTDNTEGVGAFAPLVGTRLDVAFTAGESVVYRVVGR